MLKFENTAKVGDYIRGYDFKPVIGRGDSYMEGRVTAKGGVGYGYAAYTIQIINRVLGGEEVEIEEDDEGYVPFEVSFMDYDARVINLSRPVNPIQKESING
jgi:hypothetical protein